MLNGGTPWLIDQWSGRPANPGSLTTGIMSVAPILGRDRIRGYAYNKTVSVFDDVKVTIVGITFTGGLKAPGTGGAAISFNGGLAMNEFSLRTSMSIEVKNGIEERGGSPSSLHNIWASSPLLNGNDCDLSAVLCALPGAELEVRSCDFSHNYGNAIGGADYGYWWDDHSNRPVDRGKMHGGRLTVIDSLFSYNKLSIEEDSDPRGHGGAAIYADSAAAITLLRTTFERSDTTVRMEQNVQSALPGDLKGAAIAIFETGDTKLCDGSGALVTVEHCSFTANTCGDGGADMHISKAAMGSRFLNNTHLIHPVAGSSASSIIIVLQCPIDYEAHCWDSNRNAAPRLCPRRLLIAFGVPHTCVCCSATWAITCSQRHFSSRRRRSRDASISAQQERMQIRRS